MSGFFITGTDTEIGKTFVSTVLIKLLVEQGLDVAVMKPVASGAKNIEGNLRNDDALSLMQASNMSLDYEAVNPYVFEPAISPHLAAEQVSMKINLDKIKNNFLELEQKSNVVVVEGVGGWHAPLSHETTVADLAKVLNIPIIIVVGLRLGCLNHASLTVQAIRQSGLPVVGWVANHVDKNFSFVGESIATLNTIFKDISYLGSIPHVQQSKQNKNNVLYPNTLEQTQHVNHAILLDYLQRVESN